MWQTLIDKESEPRLAGLLGRIHEAVVDYSRQDSGNGLFVGKMGTILYLSYIKDAHQSNDYDELIEDLLMNALAENDYAANSSFCAGLSGTLWGIQYLKNRQLIELDEDFEDYHQYLQRQVLLDVKDNNLDYLYGPIGSMLYLLDTDSPSFHNVKNDFLHRLREKGEESDGEIKWKTIIQSPRLNGEAGYNLSLAHGASSIMSLLASILHKDPHNQLARQLLIKSSNHVLQTKKAQPDPSYFPSYILPGKGSETESRLAWCYGDLGMSYTLYRASQVLNDSALSQQALDVLAYTTTRLSYKDTYVNDACICHGSAGVAHLFNRMYQHTGLDTFKQASLHWIKETVGFGSDRQNECAGYEF